MGGHPVNHAAIRKVNENWGKTLNELNCHLHPLDTIASSCRSTLKVLETCKGHLFGKDCFAGNIVLQINKLRYKDGKGYPKISLAIFMTVIYLEETACIFFFTSVKNSWSIMSHFSIFLQVEQFPVVVYRRVSDFEHPIAEFEIISIN